MQIMELKYTSMMGLDMQTDHLNSPDQYAYGSAQTLEVQVQPLVSFLYFARGIFQVWIWLPTIGCSDLQNWCLPECLDTFACESHKFPMRTIFI